MEIEIFEEVFQKISEVKHDSLVSKNIKEFLETIESDLRNSAEEKSLVINRVLNKLEEFIESKDLPSYIIIHLLNIASMLESL